MTEPAKKCKHCGGFGKIHDMNTNSVLTCAECNGTGRESAVATK